MAVEWFAALGFLLVVAGLVARLLIARAAEASTVDHHYWRVAARAYREQRGLPVRIPGKYLMEDETQAYPPLFGMLLGRISNGALERVTPLIEGAELLCVGALLNLFGVRWEMLLLALGCWCAAPVRVVYNAQLNPRALGALFFFTAMALQAVAVLVAQSTAAQWLCWISSAFLVGLMVMTHKMTLQLHLVLLPFWCWALQAWQVPLATLAGLVFFVVVVGWRFAVYQFRAHWDIVRFWNRHWRDLGGHQFKLSPIYGDPGSDRSMCFHAPGWKGVVKHLRVLISYAPFTLMLPLSSVMSNAWPPAWILIWVGVIYGWALATLFIPSLKCLGGGHLYVFNAVAPAAIYAAYLPAAPAVFALLAVGAVLTLASLVMAFRTVVERTTARGEEFDDVIEHLRRIPDARLAVFPLQSAEIVAAETGHAVLWGAHGYGFRQLEGFFPVLTRPLREFFDRYDIQWVLWDTKFWPEGETAMDREGLTAPASITQFGRWRLAKVSQGGHHL